MLKVLLNRTMRKHQINEDLEKNNTNRILKTLQIISVSIVLVIGVLIFFLELPNFANMDLLYYYLFLFSGIFFAPIVAITASISLIIVKSWKQILFLCVSAVWFLASIYLFGTKVITL